MNKKKYIYKQQKQKTTNQNTDVVWHCVSLRVFRNKIVFYYFKMTINHFIFENYSGWNLVNTRMFIGLVFKFKYS